MQKYLIAESDSANNMYEFIRKTFSLKFSGRPLMNCENSIYALTNKCSA